YYYLYLITKITLFLIILLVPRSSLFPYTTLFRSGRAERAEPLPFPFTVAAWNLERCLFPLESAEHLGATGAEIVLLSEMDDGMRSEEHTSELQSRENLVCRLLLEKKKIKIQIT